MFVRILGGVLLLAVIAVGGLLAVPFLVSAETVRAGIARQIESRTGWRVAFDGPVGLSVFPDIALTAEDLRIESAPDARDALAADVARVEFGLALAPLLSGSVRVTGITLEEPVVRLVRGVGPAAVSDETAADPTSTLAQVSVDRLAVVDGLVVVRGEAGETRIEDLAFTLEMPDPADETRLDARGVVDGRAMALEGSLASPLAYLSGEEAAFDLRLEAPDLLAAPLTAAGLVSDPGGRPSLRDLVLETGETRLVGSVDLVFAGDAPAIDARLEGPVLDLDALLPSSGGGGSDAIDLSALGAVVGDVELALDRLVVGGITIAPIALQAELESDAVGLVVDGAGVAGGAANGTVRIGRDGALARVSGSIGARNLDVSALTHPGAPAVTGRLGADLRFAMAGETRSALIASLNAAGRVTLDGGSASVPALAGIVSEQGADRLEGIAVALDVTDLTAPVSLTGEAAWRGTRFALSGETSPRPLLAGQPAGLTARLASDRVTLGFEGTVSPSGAIDGAASVQTGSLRDLLAWLGRPVSTPGGLGAFALTGAIDVAPGRVAMSDARLSLDGASGTGRAALTTTGGRPRLEASLALDRLDLNPYFGLSADAAPRAGGAGWSEAPVDLAALRGFDADLALTLGALRFRAVETGRAVVAARLENGRLEADLTELALYSGRGNGRVVVDAAPAAPSLAARLSLADLDTLAFLDAAAGFRRIEGRGAVSLDVTGRLVTQRTLMESLAGSMAFSFRDGAIRGIDVTELGRLLTTGIVDGWRLAEGSRTELFAFESAFAVADGVARTEDLRLVGPLVDMSGRGAVDLAAQRLDFRLDPRVAFERDRGQGIELMGFGAPIRVEGPWAGPRIYPDIAGILQDPVGAYEQLRGLGRGIFGIDVPEAGEALGRLVGEDAARGIGQLLGVPTQQPAPVQPPASGEPMPLTPPSQPPPPQSTGDPTLDAARGILDLLMRPQ